MSAPKRLIDLNAGRTESPQAGSARDAGAVGSQPTRRSTEVTTKDGYDILFLPQVNNEALQREGKPPVYRSIPNTVRLAQKANGDYKFSIVHFVGVWSQGTRVGARRATRRWPAAWSDSRRGPRRPDERGRKAAAQS